MHTTTVHSSPIIKLGTRTHINKEAQKSRSSFIPHIIENGFSPKSAAKLLHFLEIRKFIALKNVKIHNFGQQKEILDTFLIKNRTYFFGIKQILSPKKTKNVHFATSK